ncbi:MAG: hypothetical protein AB7S92_07255 [Parvibaculaceae bacterium]
MKRFYGLLTALESACEGGRTLSACSGSQKWPSRGVYFFTEPGEERSDSGAGSRIVRVGTHALKSGSSTKLWTRLSQHRGQNRTGGGNHRGSIFRLIVGTALIARDGDPCASWDDRRSTAGAEVRAGEVALEQRVSKTIGAMRFLWLDVNDDPSRDSLRGYIERNSIALLSNFGKEPIDPPSAGWLGRYCTRERVRASGLWNNNHVDEAYNPAFLERMAELVAAQDRA